MNKNILNKFSRTFSSAIDMWEKLSSGYEEIEKKDPEFSNALNQLAETLEKINDTNEILLKSDGINVDEAIKLAEQKKKKEEEDQNYPFILFVILKNLEHTGLIKINSRPERIAKSAMAAYDKKRTAKR